MRQAIVLPIAMVLLWIGTIVAQENSAPCRATRIVFDGHIATVRLAQHFTTTIRLPEPVSSVIVGDPGLFLAEHSPNEPLLVFVKPLSPTGETNILISTSNGRQFPLLLKSGLESGKPNGEFDLLVVCRAAGTSFIGESYPTSLIAETQALRASASDQENVKPAPSSTVPLPALAEKQRRGPLPRLQGDRLKVGIGQVDQHDSQLIVSFSVVNSTTEVVELMVPQVQLAGFVKSGILGTSTRWTTVDQIPVLEFGLDNRRLIPGARTDGVVVFERPALKQSNESLVLQIAEAARVDQPVLVPILFSANTIAEDNHD
jgi:hypothetical protein